MAFVSILSCQFIRCTILVICCKSYGFQHEFPSAWILPHTGCLCWLVLECCTKRKLCSGQQTALSTSSQGYLIYMRLCRSLKQACCHIPGTTEWPNVSCDMVCCHTGNGTQVMGKNTLSKRLMLLIPNFVYLLIWICLNKQLFTTFNAPGLLTKILTQCSFQLLSIQVKVVHFNHIMKTSVERWCHFPVVANLLAFMILLWSAIYFLL